jgi:crotonobetainyl-CoA:carnitine CoA-transferase CaiB-like acyl-CoA transferase
VSEGSAVGALDGLRILETGEGMAAAYCGFLLAGLGAEVLLVEPPGGHPLRAAGPFPGDVPHAETSALFLHLARGKRSIVVDTGTPAGQARLRDLALSADAVIDDQPAPRRQAAGIDFDALAAARPELVLTSVTWFGDTGPYAAWQGTELIAQAASGLMACTGEPDREPLMVGGAVAQYAAGQTAAAATLAALSGVAASGRGCRLDVSIQEAAADLLEMWSHGAYRDRAMPRLGTRHNSNYPFEVYPCADGYAGVHASPGPWEAMAELVDRRLADPRFVDRAGREGYRDEIDPIIGAWLADKTKLQAYHAGQARRFAFGYVATAADLLASEQLCARRYFVELDHPDAGRLPYPGAPFRLHRTPWRDARAPLLGEHDLGDGETGSHPLKSARSPLAPAGRGRHARGPHGGPPPNPRPLTPALPLAGVRVVDLTQIWAGPRCTKVLSDLGAEVIKVEALRRTDSTRAYDRFLAGPGPHDAAAERAYNRRLSYEQLHRGQRSVTVDLAQPAGRDRLRELVRVSDVLIANFSYGVLERLGIAYPDLAAVRPDIIAVSMTGFGDSGPERDYVAFGVTQEELCGIYALTGYPGERPLKSGSNVGDPMNGMHAACAVLAALLHRRQTGKGQYIELSQLESSVPLIGDALLDYAMNGRTAGPRGNRHPSWAPHGVYPCKAGTPSDRHHGGQSLPPGSPPMVGEGWLAIACRDNAEWSALCEVIGRTDLVRDLRFAEAMVRRGNHDVLDEVIAGWTAYQTAADAAAALQAAGVPAAPVQTSLDLPVDPHLRARGFLPALRHPGGVLHTYYGPLWLIDGARPALRGPAPLLGEHNDSVLAGLLGHGEEAKRDG